MNVDMSAANTAVRQHLAKFSPEELLRWRTAPLDRPLDAAARRIDLPMPFGWFVVSYSDELAKGEVKPLRYFGKELAIWRGEDGVVRMVDAYCRHLGSHMGHAGRVQGNDLECPFHAWHYDGNGAVTKIPYSKAIPPQARRGCIPAWHVVERNRFIWAWYHPHGVAPMFEVEMLAETSSPDWADYEKHEWIVHGPLQNLAENGVDAAHFRYIHGTTNMPAYDVKFEGIRRVASVDAKMPTPRGEVDGTISYGTVGAGQAWTRFTGICETLMVAGITPIAPDCTHVRFAFTQLKSAAQGPTAGVARGVIKDICRQLDQDKVVWDRQMYRTDALLCDGDGPILDFRRYYRQFYAELPQDGDADSKIVKRTFSRPAK
ncbi:MAG: aromatic ring-hydroxylating dioxygenase subunit alpha [Gammaproteobacteria bacterium]|nr:aromatic ring-hydroxylating dioxygenase subunit alpha [Gammaproteobacteria bacterium]